ncbi:serine/threonine-protein kinase [Candidatus Uabimicrobium amorphum]|uniref:non-specific serine/threonine protein kinase n=1 Tax=Uabimicrobium amorphum TaxID=2596890 RepID=A0A5S9IJY8_UABAM|nr:serine/threonine-protein kinase [Candidatus Uabimicrobium amorphum]BBM81985.1 putative serine/threonine-protein kinase PknB [Candidatus Uabimicrobium amorphum]
MQLRISKNYHVKKCIYRLEDISLFLAQNITSQEQVIVQQLSVKYEKMFLLEYEKLKEDRDQNILHVVDVKVSSKELLAMWRYFPHMSLKQFCNSPQKLPEKISVTLQIIQGIQSILQQSLFSGILHPQNIVYTKQKKIIFFYFGLFTSFPQQESYMPYEDSQRNIYYALGIFIYQIMCGNSPINDAQSIKDDFLQLSYASQHEQILYDTLGEFVRQCLENYQVDFQNTIEFLQGMLDNIVREREQSEKKTLPLKYEGKKKIGKHILENVIGQGASGIVYKAWNEELRRDVAIKILHQNNKRFVVRFKREADVISRLNHPNIVKLYEINLEPPIYFTMQYISGIPIDDFIKLKKLSFREIAEVFVQVLEAMDYAHNQKVIHRDLKPSNILIDEKGCPYIMDFGIAKVEDSYQVTKTGELVGTLFYMSPEQAKMSKNLDSRSDIYSVGIILYQVLTDTLPFIGNTPIQIMHEVATKVPTSPEKLNKHVPVILADICMKAIEKSSDSRYQTAQEMSRDLQYFVQGKYFKVSAFRRKFFHVPQVRMRTIAIFLVVLCAITFFLFPRYEESPALFFHVQSEKYLTQKYDAAYDKDKREIGQRLIVLKVKLKKYKEAIEIYREISQGNLAKKTLFEVAKTYYLLGKNEKALVLLKECSASDIQGEAFYYQGLIFYEKQQFPTAKQFFRKALSHNKNKELIPQTQLYLGICNMKMKNPLDARKQLKAAQKEMAQDIRVWKYLGKSYLPQNFEQQGSREDLQFAYECFTKCIQLDSNTSEYYTLAAQSCLHLREYYEAHRLIKIALGKNAGDVEALNTQLYLSYREPFLQYAGFVLQSQSAANLVKVTEPDLFHSYFAELEKIYRDDFMNRVVALRNKHQKTDLNIFLKPLTKRKLDTKILESITKGLFSLRYQKNLQKQLRQFYKNTTYVAQKRLDKINFELKSFVANENKYNTYYKVAYLYNKIKQSNITHHETISEKQAQKIFEKETKLTIRYATAKVMIHTGQWDFLLKMLQKTPSTVNKIILSCALREVGYYQPLVLKDVFIIAERLHEKDQEFLLALSAKNIAIYSSPLPQQRIKNNVNILKALLHQKNYLVRLCAASSAFSTLYNDEEVRIVAEKILLEAMKNSSPTIRAYSHYHFWNSYYTVKNAPKYMEVLRWGMQDANTEVNACVMNHAGRFTEQMKALQDELIDLAHRNMGNQVALQSIFNLVLIDPSHPKVLMFQNDERYPSFFRIYTFILSKYYFTVYNIGRNPQLLRENVRKLIDKSSQVVYFKKNDIKAFFYYAGASWGFHPLRTMKKEKNPFIIANIIANLKLPRQPSAIIKMMLPNLTRRQKDTVLNEYKNHPSPQVQRSILAVRIAFATLEERYRIYYKVKNASRSRKIAAAEGFYSIIRNGAFPYMYGRQNIQNFLEEASYDNYLQSFYRLMKDAFSKDYNKFLEYKRYLEYALELNPEESRYFYEIALVNDMQKKTTTAIANLKKAVEINPKSSRYKYLLAQMLHEAGHGHSQILPLLFSAEKNTVYTPLLSNIAHLYMDLELWDRAQYVLQKIFLVDPLAINHALDLTKVYVQQNRYQQAEQHLQMLIDIEKRLALNSQDYKPYINERLLKQDSILRNIYRK